MPDIAIVGEAWGRDEERERRPFVGAAGWHLTKMLSEAGIVRGDCFLTNVFNIHPPGNRLEELCGLKGEAIDGYPALTKSKYVRAEFEPELVRLQSELYDCAPNIIVATGNTAMWALLGRLAITKMRGTTFKATHLVPGFKVLPTYHPSFIMRGNEGWQHRPTVICDLIKAKRESEYPEIRRPERTIYVPETIEDLDAAGRALCKAERLAVDIETAVNQVTCIGFAPTPGVSYVIPFVANGYPGWNYWKFERSEYHAWALVQRILADPNIKKTFQNGLYDISFLIRSMKFKVFGADEDTMLLHHALQPEALKGLGFLGSIYTDEGNWKLMRTVETIKRDD